jgi:hypothetical protein
LFKGPGFGRLELENNFKRDQKIYNIEPQASILSLVLVTPYIAIFAFSVAYRPPDDVKALLNRSAITFSNVFRCPVTVLMTYKAHKAPNAVARCRFYESLFRPKKLWGKYLSLNSGLNIIKKL